MAIGIFRLRDIQSSRHHARFRGEFGPLYLLRLGYFDVGTARVLTSRAILGGGNFEPYYYRYWGISAPGQPEFPPPCAISGGIWTQYLSRLGNSDVAAARVSYAMWDSGGNSENRDIAIALF